MTPIYLVSLEALSAVKLNDVLEVAKYRAPPAPLNPLFNALCMLFDREERYDDILFNSCYDITVVVVVFVVVAVGRNASSC